MAVHYAGRGTVVSIDHERISPFAGGREAPRSKRDSRVTRYPEPGFCQRAKYIGGCLIARVLYFLGKRQLRSGAAVTGTRVYLDLFTAR